MASSRSASSSMTIGPLPPSSRIWVLPAAPCATRLPVATDPTKPTASTPGWETTALPTVAPGPGRKLNTPGGRPPCAITSASRPEQAEVDELGFQTTLFPAASAGAKTSAPIV